MSDRKFDLLRGENLQPVAWSISIEYAKELLDTLHQEEYKLILSDKTAAYTFQPNYMSREKRVRDEIKSLDLPYEYLLIHEDVNY